ncbi:hypothetical protein F5Y17DRAFT_456994 [Xylariaceae sp. FL0594]|nr:hypothetical protein F5Y17DRAFT_456994 [Xylariaceae sp. FL0594]
MTTAPPAPASKKLSFAKVLASHPKEFPSPVHVPRVAVAVPNMDRLAQATATGTTVANASSAAPTPPASGRTSAQDPSTRVENTQTLVNDAVNESNTPSKDNRATSTPSLVVNGSSSLVVGSRVKVENSASLSDDVSQRTDSNSEIGTKAPSVDGKSITSGTTFNALDEKESLRPDDSASVKAGADDDEAFSFRGSLLATSRLGSENARVHRLRIGDMPEKRIVQVLPEARDEAVVTPQSGTSSQQPPPEQPQTLGAPNAPSEAFNSIYGKNPDEKLLEAMKSPKDRIFLLKLEQDVINFVQSSKEPYMDLPPNNSFCRMLTHKLADYYHMTHSFEAVQNAVRIYRTPFCRVPPSLASIIENKADESPKTPPPVVLPKKIMRRGEDGGSGQVSTNASKATSEVGSDGKDKTIAKEKMTREEREEAYKIARERIFGSSADKAAEPGTENGDANGLSRASSVSARDKSTMGKRGKTGKQRRDDSESFDSRSQYVRYFPPAVQMSPYEYGPAGLQYGVQVPQQYQYQTPTAQVYQPAPQGYPPMMANNGYQQYANVPIYPSQSHAMPPRYSSTTGSGGAAGYVAPTQTTPQQTWQPVYNQTPSPPLYQHYPNRGPQPQAQANAGQMPIPYPFGQLPANANPHDPKSQHPIPGSYNRHALNPKIQSFVPSNGISPVQPPMGSHNMAAPHGSPQIGQGSPHLGYAGYSSPVGPPQPYMGGPGYGMSRQSSNNSLPPYHAPHHLPQHPQAHASHMVHKQGGPPQGPSAGVGHGQAYSHLPNYGNPATLPQKPPTGI